VRNQRWARNEVNPAFSEHDQGFVSSVPEWDIFAIIPLKQTSRSSTREAKELVVMLFTVPKKCGTSKLAQGEGVSFRRCAACAPRVSADQE